MQKIILLICIVNICTAQKQDRQWVFPASCGIDWTDSLNPVTYTSSAQNVQAFTTASIADSNGLILFYAQGFTFAEAGGRVYNRLHQTMLNGDSIQGYPFCGNGFMILPMPGSNHLYYLFTITRNGASGGYSYCNYNIVDMNGDGGFGEVISRDNTIINEEINENVASTKHGNGRDWWIVLGSPMNNYFSIFLLNDSGIILHSQQSIGLNTLNFYYGQSFFSKDGLYFVTIGTNANIELFDFNRCTGIMSNNRTGGENSFSQENAYFGGSISTLNKIIYTTSIEPDHKKLYQFNLDSTNILASKQLINFYPDTGISQNIQYGHHLMGPDGRIYISKGNPYIPNANTAFTQSLDAILYPDSPGVACAYTPSFLHLGGNFSASGLPNIPNYNLGSLVGSVCDTIHVGIASNKEEEKMIDVIPNPFYNKIYIQPQNITNEKIIVKVYNNVGIQMFIKTTTLKEQEIDLSKLNQGVYLITVMGDKIKWSEKIVKLK